MWLVRMFKSHDNLLSPTLTLRSELPTTVPAVSRINCSFRFERGVVGERDDGSE